MRFLQQARAVVAFATLGVSLSQSGFAVAPTIDPLNATFSPAQVPVGKSLVVPISATNPDGGAVTFTVTSSDARIQARIKTGNPVLRLHVKYTGANPFEGDVDFQLFRDLAPVTTGTIGGFAQGGYYDGLIFHRVVKGFVAQAGDPLGNGTGGPGFTFGHEFQPSLLFTGKYQLAMANSSGGYNRGFTSREDPADVPAGQIALGDFSATNGSQFFITQSNQHNNLDFKHTIFGQLIRGFSILDQMDNVPVNASSKPNTNVTIVSAKVLPDPTAATIMLGAAGLTSSTITVTATNGSGQIGSKTFVANSVADTVNDRPLMGALRTLNAPVGAFPSISVTAVDLEGDFENFGIAAVNSSNQLSIGPNSIGTAAISNNYGVISSPGVQTFTIGVAQSDNDSRNNAPQAGIDGSGNELEFNPFATYSWQVQRFIFGDKVVRTEIAPVEATAGTSIATTVARISDTDPAGKVGDYTAEINWGDGAASTAVTAGTVVRDATRPGTAVFAVNGTHTYAHPGVFTATTTINWTAPGGTAGEIARVGSPVYVSAAGTALRAKGTSVTASTASIANRIVATFTDTVPSRRATDYVATVDWGDGVSARAVVVKNGPGRFAVRGSHVYKDPEAFSLAVRIHPASASDASTDGTTWSTATVSGFAPARHAPPFLLTHLHADWDSISKVVTAGVVSPYVPGNLQVQLRGRLTAANSGSRTSAGWTIRSYLSADQTLDLTGPNADTPLLVNGNAAITVGSLGPGASVNTGDPSTNPFVVALPKGESGGRKYLLTQAVYSDPIIDHSAVSKVSVVGPIAARLFGLDKSGTETTQSGGTVTFKIVLDTAPAAGTTVTVPIVSTDTAQGKVSPAQVVFTPAGAQAYNIPVLVTVTGQNDNNPDQKNYQVKVGPATSTDSLFSGLAGFTLDLTNKP